MNISSMWNQYISNISVRRKLNLLTALIAIGVITLSVVAARLQYVDLYDTRLATIQAQVEAGNSVLAHYAAQANSGQISLAQAQAQAIEVLANMRTESNGMYYTLFDTSNDTIVMHPFRRDRAGSPLDQYVDPNGIKYNALLSEQARRGGGYVTYHSNRSNNQDPVARVSYAQPFSEWNWATSTGTYVTDIQEQAMAFTRVMAITGGILVLLVFSLAWVIGNRIILPLRKATAVAHAIANGNLDNDTRADGHDEPGRLLISMGEMQDKLHAVISATRKLAAEHRAGSISQRIDTHNLPGDYGLMGDEVNALTHQHVQTAQMIATLVQEYAQGDLRRDPPQLHGEQITITTAMQTVKANLLAISSEITRLSEAAVNGDFSIRGDSSRFQFGFATMVNRLNELMATTDTSLQAISQLMQAIADGDLTHRMNGEYRGVFAQMRDDANTTVDNLISIVTRIQQSGIRLEMAAGEISSANADLSRRTEQQAANLEETAASMEEMTSTVRQNADHAQQANQLALQAADVTGQASEAVSNVVTTMTAIEQSSRKIADIISVIDSIAFQTNILALNAAVEAARAGEQGRGFAVVAGEVRILAQRSAAAAKEIKILIDTSVEQVGTGTLQVGKAGDTMNHVMSSVQRVTGIMGQISAASLEQSAGIDQVSQTIMHMDESTQQNAAMVEEASAAAHAMEAQTRELVAAAAAFRLH